MPVVFTVDMVAMHVIDVIAVDDCGVPATGAVGMGVRLGRRVADHRLSSSMWVRASVMMCSMWASLMRYTISRPRRSAETIRP